MDALPNELLLQIWGFLDSWDSEPPSFAKFNDEPSTKLTVSEHTPLKTLALVCKRWRRVLLPELFKYSRIELDDEECYLRLGYSVLGEMRARQDQLSSHESQVWEHLRSYVDNPANHPMLRDPMRTIDLEYIQEDDHVFRQLTPLFGSWVPTCQGTVRSYLNFVKENGLDRRVHSLVVYTNKAFPDKPSEPELNKANQERYALWKSIFKVLNPSRVVVAAPPSTMAIITAGWMHTDDSWAFDMLIHYLELRQQDPPYLHETPGYEIGTGSPAYHTCLHNIRKWTHLGYNEGSSLAVYSTYEYFWKRPPMILYYLLTWISKEAKYPPAPKLESFEFTALFPLNNHVGALMEPLHKMESLKQVTFSMAPSPQSSILEDAQRVGQADLKDCWLELEKSYKAVVDQLAMKRVKPNLTITCQEYGNEALERTLDNKFRAVAERGWLKFGNSWVKPEIMNGSLLN